MESDVYININVMLHMYPDFEHKGTEPRAQMVAFTGLGVASAVFRAYFVDGQNIGKTSVLVRLAESIHLNGKDAQKVIQDRTYKDAVDLDWKRSYELGVTAVPTFLFNNQRLVGAQNFETLEEFLMSNNAIRRNLVE